MIEAENLRKTFGQTECLKGIDFQVSAGEILGFLGPNGAGKTTTIKILTGLLRASSGKARLNNLDVEKDFSKIQPLLGYLPEDAPAWPEMRIADFLMFIASVKGIPGREQKKSVEAALDEVQMLPNAKRLISNISKGMRQRVGLAQAILGDPKIVILDEPTVGLDPGQIVQIRNVIRSMKERRTVLFSTHILPNIQEVCTHVVIINNGTVMAKGPISEVGEMGGGSSLEIRVAANGKSEKEIIEKLDQIITRNLDGKHKLKTKGTESSGFFVSVPEFPDDPVLRQKVLKEMLEADLMVSDFVLRQPTLEDIFLRAVSQTRPSEAA